MKPIFKVLFHALGLACIGGSVFLSVLIFTDIIKQGFFFGYEPNKLILYIEYMLVAFTVFYYLLLAKEYLFGGKKNT